MQLSDKDYEQYKKILQKDGVHYDTEEDYREAIDNLVAYAELAYEVAKEEYRLQQRLKDEPKGFIFTGEGRTCPLCCRNVMGDMWYDKMGQKCLNCQEAYKKKIIPGYVFNDSNNDRHIDASTLSWKYGLKLPTIRKLIRQGELKPRIGPNGPMIFLRSENPNLPAIISNLANNQHEGTM